MALARYTALRIALFLATAVVLYLAGVRNLFLCALIAILVSGLVSVVALKGVRSQVVVGARSGDVDPGDGSAAEGSSEAKPRKPRQSPLKRISERIDAAARAEDEADDAERAALGEDLPPIPRPDLPGWEHHVPGADERTS